MLMKNIESEPEEMVPQTVPEGTGTGRSADVVVEVDTVLEKDGRVMDEEETCKMPEAKARMYRPEIDGLRAVAVLPVVFYHFHLSFPGGYTGVDVFFVISGFLITGILRKHLTQNQKRYMLTFWNRRARRLMAASFTVMAVVLLIFHGLVTLNLYEQVVKQVFSALLFYTNIHFYMQSDSSYSFAPKNQIRPLLHFWSLCVEEQFYFVLPTLMLFIPRRHDLKLLVFLFVGSFVTSAVLMNAMEDMESFSFYMLPTRAWEMALGGLLTFAALKERYHNISAVIGLAMILISYGLYSHDTSFPGPSALLPCAGTALILLADSECLFNKVLSIPPLVYIGKISYSLYLWHWPMYEILIVSTGVKVPIAPGSHEYLVGLTPYVTAIGVVLSFVLAIFSYDHIETPFRNPKRVKSKLFWPVIGLSWVTLMVYTIVWQVYNFGGLEMLYPPMKKQPPNAILFEAGTFDNQSYVMDADVIDIGSILASSPQYDYKQPLFETSDGGDSPDIVMLGTSKCTQTTTVLTEIIEEVGMSTGYLCRPIHGIAWQRPYSEFDQKCIDQIHAWKPKAILWMGSFTNQENMDVDAVFADLRAFGAKVYLIGETPFLGIGSFDLRVEVLKMYQGVKEASFRFLTDMDADPTYGGELKKSYDIVNAWEQHFNNKTEVEVIDTTKYFINPENGNVLVVDPFTGHLAYTDPYHLNHLGVRRMVPLYRKILQEINNDL